MYFIPFLVLIGAFATDQPAPCHLPIDIAFLQDITGSFKEDLPIVASQIPAIVESVQATNPGSKWAIASFQDKPYMPLGETTDICYNLASGLKSSSEDVLKAYEGLRAGGGGDLPESQYTALINLALDKRVDWRPVEYQTKDSNKTGAKLIIMSTDAQPHMPLDANLYDSNAYPDLPKDLPPHWGGFTQEDPLNECKNFDYPTPYQVRDILLQEDITLAILTPNTNDKVVGAWKWVNEELLGQSPAMYRFIDENCADIHEEIVGLIKSLTEIECAQTTPIPDTTTEETTTVKETTTMTDTTTLNETTTMTDTTTLNETTTLTDTTTLNETTTTKDTTTLNETTTTKDTTTLNETTTMTDTTTLNETTTMTDTTTLNETTAQETTTTANETTAQETTAQQTTSFSPTHAECQCPETCPEPVCHCDCCDQGAEADEGFTGLQQLALRDVNLKEVMLLAVPRKPKALRITYD